MIKEFSLLHAHSMFSFQDGISTPEEMVRVAKQKGLRSIAITDHGNAAAHADIYIQGKKQGQKVIFGVEAYAIDSLQQWKMLKEKFDLDRTTRGKKVAKEKSDEEFDEEKDSDINVKELRKKGHLVLLACNRTGLSNLYQLIYKSFRDGFYAKPRMDKEMLKQHAEGLISTSACMSGVIASKCWEMYRGECEWDAVVKECNEYQEIFGKGRFFLELQFNESEAQVFINDCLIRAHKETAIPLVVTTDAHYPNEDDWKTQEILYMLRANKTFATRGEDWKFDIKQLYIKSPQEMWESYKKFGQGVDEVYAIQAFENTLLMDSLVEDYEPDTTQRLPSLEYENTFRELGKRAIEGLDKLKLADNEKYRQQLLHELKVIKDKKLQNYFLITDKIVRECKKKMMLGAGRGSAGGSLVCYALGITDLDPIIHNLMFERFLDPSRTEVPDIDIDYRDTEEAKELLRELFGKDNVACLSTYGTYQVKGLLKDLARVYDLDHNEINKLNKKIDTEIKAIYVNQDKSTIIIKLEDIEKYSPAFNKFVEQHPEIYYHFKKLYGRVRHMGRHASGVIIGDNLPAETALTVSDSTVQTAFTEGIVNKNISIMGFVKFDVLSIATLKIIEYALQLISQRTGIPFEELKENHRAHKLDLNDMKVMKHVFWNGNTCSIFQITSKGMKALYQQVKPDCFNDVAAVTALYRPGPLGSGMHKMYGENKQKYLAGELKYEHPILEDILKETYACLVYQEQLMKFCAHAAKMSWKDVQRVRKNLLKKDKSKSEEFVKNEAKELREIFVNGLVENGFTQQRAEEWWKNCLAWGGYGFNASHSKTYSVMTMQCAHLATYYPIEFYTAALTKGQVSELQEYVSDIQKTGIKILPVDVNKSKLAHTIEKLDNGKEAIRLSLSSILGVGPAAIEKIMAGQPYNDFIDFLERSGASKASISPLILTGAFDCMGYNMKELEAKYEALCANPKWKVKKNGHLWLEKWNEEWKDGDYSLYQKIDFENQLLGFSLRGSPFSVLDRDKKIEAAFGNVVVTYKEFVEGEEETVLLPVVVKDIKEKSQKNGKMMAWLKFATQDNEEFEVPCFANIWNMISDKIKKSSVYVITFSKKEGEDGLIFGKPGWRHSASDIASYVINIDEIEL
jgi:DNA polymerase III subunit alpha